MADGYTFTLLTAEEAREIAGWRYAGPYAVYNVVSAEGDGVALDAVVADQLDRRSPYYAVRDARDDLLGYFAFGSAAELGGSEPHLLGADGMLSIGLGMRPERTGLGVGLDFVRAGLDFAARTFAPTSFRLFVMTFNRRATRVYERADFRQVGIVRAQDGGSEREFLEMRRSAREAVVSSGDGGIGGALDALR